MDLAFIDLLNSDWHDWPAGATDPAGPGPEAIAALRELWVLAEVAASFARLLEHEDPTRLRVCANSDRAGEAPAGEGAAKDEREGKKSTSRG